MRTYAFSLLPGGQIRITSSMPFTWKLAPNHSRASRNRGSRRSSNSRNIKLTCSFVASPMFPPLVWIVGFFFAELGERTFVRAGPVNRRNWNIENSQIDGELPAMVIVMIHEDRANEADPRDRHQNLSVFRQAPRGHEPSIIHFLEGVLCARKALRESVQNFLAALGLR